MLIFINIKRLRDHTLLLNMELKEMQLLEEQLLLFQNEVPLDNVSSLMFIKKHLNVVRTQMEHISRRISLLESTVERFSDTKSVVEGLLSDAQINLEKYSFLYDYE